MLSGFERCGIETCALPPQEASGKTFDQIADELGLTNAYVAQVRASCAERPASEQAAFPDKGA